MNPTIAAQDALSSFFGEREVTFPIDPVQVARSVGINVYRGAFDNSLSGMLAKPTAESGVDMFVNEAHAPVRQRFTVAHELGHFFSTQQDSETAKGPYFFKRNALSACGTNRDEIFANAFAAELLMPAKAVSRLRSIGMSDVAMASRFQVSLDAMRIRLQNVQ